MINWQKEFYLKDTLSRFVKVFYLFNYFLLITFSLPPHHPTFSLFLYSPKFMPKISQNQNKRESQNKQTEGKQTNKQ